MMPHGCTASEIAMRLIDHLVQNLGLSGRTLSAHGVAEVIPCHGLPGGLMALLLRNKRVQGTAALRWGDKSG